MFLVPHPMGLKRAIHREERQGRKDQNLLASRLRRIDLWFQFVSVLGTFKWFAWHESRLR
jgi:hypothetical protein